MSFGKPLYTKDQDEYIKANWRRLKADTIADALGKTRNSVIGRANRLGLCRANSPRLSAERLVERVPKRRLLMMKKASNNDEKVDERSPQIDGEAPQIDERSPQIDKKVVSDIAGKRFDMVVIDDDVDEKLLGKILITDLPMGRCRFPVEEINGRHFFCGEVNATHSNSYCYKHCAVAYAGYSKPVSWNDRRKRYR